MTRMAAVGLALATLAIGVQRPAFRSGADAVRVDVQVLRNGQPVAGLTTADFEVKDSGVVQRIEALSLEQEPVDVLFLLDTSASMRGEPIDRLKEAAHAAVGALDARDRVALLTFSHVLAPPLDWTDDRRATGAAIDALTADGNTSLTDAVFTALTMREHARGRMLVLAFSDGFDTASWLDPLRVVDLARRSDLVTETVYLGSNLVVLGANTSTLASPVGRKWYLEEPVPFREQFLPVLAQQTGGETLTPRREGLAAAFVRIVRNFKMRYVLSFTPEHVPAEGWHPLDVKLTRVKADLHARPGYQR
jgi:VWFA-related protein